MLLTIILCRALALLFYNFVIVENMQTGSFNAIGTSSSAMSRLARGNWTDGRKMGQDPA